MSRLFWLVAACTLVPVVAGATTPPTVTAPNIDPHALVRAVSGAPVLTPGSYVMSVATNGSIVNRVNVTITRNGDGSLTLQGPAGFMEAPIPLTIDAAGNVTGQYHHQVSGGPNAGMHPSTEVGILTAALKIDDSIAALEGTYESRYADAFRPSDTTFHIVMVAQGSRFPGEHDTACPNHACEMGEGAPH